MVSGRGPKGSSVGVGPSVQHPTGMSDILFFFATGRFNSQGEMFNIFCKTFKKRYRLSNILNESFDIPFGFPAGWSNISTGWFSI